MILQYPFKIKIQIGAILFLVISSILASVSCTKSKVAFNSNQDKTEVNKPWERTFEMLDPATTQIDFVNLMRGQRVPPHTQYVNVFNGGGVAIGDINNDGLQDIYFTGNAVGNRLYLNKGDFKFEDITVAANVGLESHWSNGAIFTDINNDGYEDLYVSCALYLKEEARENKLFINNGDNTFTEQSRAYGIHDSGFSIQSAFIDIDNDGDNDLFVGNHPLSRYKTEKEHLEMFRNPQHRYSDHLYRNNGDGTFTDITEASGILNYGWTLSFTTSDFNDDGLTDIYIAKDHAQPDLLFINQGDNIFINKADDYFKHISMSSMGSDLSDINNDGHLDLFTVEMLSTNNYREKTQMAPMNPQLFNKRVKDGYHHQYMRNMLHLNSGKEGFSEIGQLSGIQRSDWSWSALFFDFDNDLDEDLFIANGYYFDILDKDFRKNYTDLLKTATTVQEETRLMVEAYKIAPSTPTANKFYANNSDLTFRDVSNDATIISESFSSGASYADLNNDGKMDLIVSNIDQSPFIYKNIHDNPSNYISFKLKGYSNNDPVGSRLTLKLENESIKVKEYIRARGYVSGISSLLHFGLGSSTLIESAHIEWPNGVIQELEGLKVNQVNEIIYAPSTIDLPVKSAATTVFTEFSNNLDRHEENFFDDYKIQVLLPHKMSELGPLLSKGDINRDGREDVFIGGSSAMEGKIYLNNGNGQFTHLPAPDIAQNKNYEDMGSALIDVDGDGDLDLYVASGGYERPDGHSAYQDRLYINEDGNFRRNSSRLPDLRISSGRVVPADYDGDGDIDILVTGRQNPHKYPHPTSTYILQNDGAGYFKNVTSTLSPDLENIGMINDAAWVDLDGDENLDLILAGEWTAVHVFMNVDGKLVDRTKKYNMDGWIGWWNKIEIADVDKDGDQDIIAGNLGLNYKYQATNDKPFHIYSNDFDESGSTDIVLGYYFENDVLYPVRGKQCSSEQIPSISEKMPSYREFASASLIDIYGDALSEGLHYEATEFRSGVFINEGETFRFQPFPNKAQIAPINGIVLGDYNQDGIIDVLAGGNLYQSEVETGRVDAGKGFVLLGNGDGTFACQNMISSGLNADGDVKDIIQLKEQNQSVFLFARNNDVPLTYKITNKNLQ